MGPKGQTEKCQVLTAWLALGLGEAQWLQCLGELLILTGNINSFFFFLFKWEGIPNTVSKDKQASAVKSVLGLRRGENKAGG